MMEISVYKQANSNVYNYYFRLNGKRYRKSTGETDETRAKAVANKAYVAAVEASAKEKAKEDVATISLADAFDRVLKTVEGSTKASYDLSKRKFCGGDIKSFDKKSVKDVARLPDGIMLHEIDEDMIDDLIEARKSEGASNGSINNELRALKRVVNYNSRKYLTNPRLKITELPKKAKTRYITDDEEKAILAILEDKGTESYRKARNLFILAMDTGARLEEMRSLRWKDVKFDEGVIEVFRSKTDDVVLLPLSDRCAAMLQHELDKKSPTPMHGMSRAIKHLRRIIGQVCNTDEQEIKRRGKATIHSCRDSFATKLVKANLSLHQVAKLLSHSTQHMSAKYSHLEASEVVTAAASIINKR